MKKIIAILMLLCMFTGAALAEAAPELNWADAEAIIQASEVAGDFVNFDEIAVKIWIPEGLNAVELSDEDKEAGFIGYFTDAEQTAVLSVVYANVDGTSIEDYATSLGEMDSVANVAMATVNGMPCVSYDMPEQDSSTVAFATEAGYILEVTVAPVSDENAQLVWGVVLSSIQPE